MRCKWIEFEPRVAAMCKRLKNHPQTYWDTCLFVILYAPTQRQQIKQCSATRSVSFMWRLRKHMYFLMTLPMLPSPWCEAKNPDLNQRSNRFSFAPRSLEARKYFPWVPLKMFCANRLSARQTKLALTGHFLFVELLRNWHPKIVCTWKR